MVYPALLPLIRTPRLPVVDWTDAPGDLKELVRFAERRNLVSARVPSHFNWPLPPEHPAATFVESCFETFCPWSDQDTGINTSETLFCLDTARQSIRMDMNTGETPNNSNKAKAVRPAKLTQFATKRRSRLWEWVESKMEGGRQIRFPRLATNIDEAWASTYKHTWRILHYVIILGTLVPLLTQYYSVSVVNYIEITRTCSITAFTRGYSVGIGGPKLCNKLILLLLL